MPTRRFNRPRIFSNAEAKILIIPNLENLKMFIFINSIHQYCCHYLIGDLVRGNKIKDLDNVYKKIKIVLIV